MMAKVIDVTGRIPKMPSFEELERVAAAEEAYAEEIEAEPFDFTSARDKALSVNGAMSSLDYIATQCGGITGKQYWAVYTAPTARAAFIAQALNSHAILSDILAEYERLPEAERPKPWSPPKVEEQS